MKILVIASAEWLNKKLLFLTIPLVWLTILIAPMLGGQSAESARDTWLLIAVGSAFPLTAHAAAMSFLFSSPRLR